jgi:uncharacterized RDD family membrane protein YckC
MHERPKRGIVRSVDSEHALPADAGRGSRFFGALIDIALLVVLRGVGTVAAFAVEGPEAVFVWGAPLALIAIQAVLVSRRGQSIGKLAMRIRIERADGRRVGFVHGVLLRSWLMAWLNATPLVFLLDSLFIFGRERRCLHDRLADTRVVQLRPDGSPA